MNKLASKGYSREEFLKLCTRILLSLAGILGLGGLIRFFSYQPDLDSPTTYTLGSIEDFPTSGMLVRPDIPAVIYRSNQGFQAYSLICTHLGCSLEENGEGFFCPCHGSQYDPVGIVLKGPAREDLEVLDVEVTKDGELLVHTGGGTL